MCCIFTLSVYRSRSLGELGACCSQRQSDRKCKPLCWRVYFCSDKICTYKGPLYSARGPQRGGAERAHLANPPPCELPSVISECLRAQAHLPPPSHWGHWGGSPRDTLHSEPSLTHSVLQKSLGGYNKKTPISPSHSCALRHLFHWECEGHVCDAGEAARSLWSHPSLLLPVPHVSLTLLRRKWQLPGMQGQL